MGFPPDRQTAPGTGYPWLCRTGCRCWETDPVARRLLPAPGSGVGCRNYLTGSAPTGDRASCRAA